jgi:hypothetical protein
VAGDGSDTDGAVATEHERDLVFANRAANTASGVLHNLDDPADVLRAPILAIRPPSKELAVPEVAYLYARAPQLVGKTRVAQRSRRLFLAWSKRPGAGWDADHTESCAHRASYTDLSRSDRSSLS